VRRIAVAVATVTAATLSISDVKADAAPRPFHNINPHNAGNDGGAVRTFNAVRVDLIEAQKLEREGKLEAAKALLAKLLAEQEALAPLLREMCKEQELLALATREQLAAITYEKGDEKLALQQFKKLHAGYEASCGKDAGLTKAYAAAVGNILFSLGQLEEAEIYFDKAKSK